MTTPTLITVAPTGAESAKTDVPALPVTLDELVTTAKECAAIGASVIHVHVRDEHRDKNQNDRFDPAQQSGRPDVDVLVIEGGDVIQHVRQRSSLFADSHHFHG